MSIKTTAQEVNFLSFYNTDAVYSHYSDIEIVEDSIIAFGQLNRDGLQGIIFSKYDTSGILLDSLTYFDTNYLYSIDQNQNIVIDSIGNIYACGNALNLMSGNTSAIIIKVSPDFELDFVSHLNPDSYSLNEIVKSIAIDSSGIFLFGTSQLVNLNVQLLRIRCDTNGNRLSSFLVGSPLEQNFLGSVSFRNRSSVFMAGSKDATAWIVEVDSSGQIIWEWESFAFDFIRSVDEIYVKNEKLFFSMTEINSQSFANRRPIIGCIDYPSKSILWQEDVGEYGGQLNFFRSISASKCENELLWSGSRHVEELKGNEPLSYSGAWHYTTDTLGTFLWSSVDTIQIGNSEPSSSIQINDSEYGPSDNIYSCGIGTVESGVKHSLIIRIDSKNEDCEVVSTKETPPNIEVTLFPNPTNGILNIQIDSYDLFSAKVLDINGVIVDEQQGGSSIDGMYFDLALLPNANYIVEIEVGGQVVSERIIKID